jgi:hypothetical protein
MHLLKKAHWNYLAGGKCNHIIIWGRIFWATELETNCDLIRWFLKQASNQRGKEKRTVGEHRWRTPCALGQTICQTKCKLELKSHCLHKKQQACSSMPEQTSTHTMNQEQILSHSKRRELIEEHCKIFNGDTTWYLATLVLILTLCRTFLLFLKIKQNR